MITCKFKNENSKQSTKKIIDVFEKKINQLQFILIVKNLIDVMRKNSSKKYIEMLIDLLRIRNKNVIDDIHDIIKIKNVSCSTYSKNRISIFIVFTIFRTLCVLFILY